MLASSVVQVELAPPTDKCILLLTSMVWRPVSRGSPCAMGNQPTLPHCYNSLNTAKRSSVRVCTHEPMRKYSNTRSITAAKWCSFQPAHSALKRNDRQVVPTFYLHFHSQHTTDFALGKTRGLVTRAHRQLNACIVSQARPFLPPSIVSNPTTHFFHGITRARTHTKKNGHTM